MSDAKITLTGRGWPKLDGIARGRLREAFRVGMRRGVRQAALVVQARIKANISKGRQEHDALHPFTVARKGSSRPLVDHGDMLNSVNVQFPSDLVAMVGVNRMSADGKANIAAVQEFGATIGVTDKMRGYLARQGLHLRRDTVAIVIPARPFVGPAWEESRDDVREIMGNSVRDELVKLAS